MLFEGRKPRIYLIAVLISLSLLNTALGGVYGGGSGTAEDPYLIGTAQDIVELTSTPDDWDKHFLLTADIDLAYQQITPIGLDETTPFAGVFDGNDHIISNFTYSAPNADYIGLFGWASGQITNLGLVNVNVEARSWGAGLVGFLSGVLTNCYVTGCVSTSLNGGGGLVGENHGRIDKCYSVCTILGGSSGHTGGLVATNYGTVIDSHAGGSVRGSIAGGLIGYSHGGPITDSWASAEVNGLDDTGGLIGHCQNEVTIANCYAKGNVISSGEGGFGRTGGLIGGFHYGTIKNCYATGSVKGNSFSDTGTGGLIGNTGFGLVTNSYATGLVSGRNRPGGLIGKKGQGSIAILCFWDVQTSGQSTSEGGQGRTTAQMKQAETFFGWNSCGEEIIWTIEEGNDYPHLLWENQPGALIPAHTLGDLLEGSGTLAEPYLVNTAQELNFIGLFPCEWDKHFRLTQDIDLSVYKGVEFNPIGLIYDKSFTGVFDGNGNTILNFTYTANVVTIDYQGLFGYVRDPGHIMNINLEDVNVAGNTVGGVVGYNNGGLITGCSVEGRVTAQWSAGLLAGFHQDGVISDCFTKGSVSGGFTNLMGSAVGGLVGGNHRSTITNSYSTASVSANLLSGGGLVGSNNLSTISHCYAAGYVSGSSDTGGLVGKQPATVLASFWDLETSGQPTSAGGTGKTTEEMQTRSTYVDAGWDFANTWAICESTNYPRLLWQISSGDFVCPDGINFEDYSFLARKWRESDCSGSDNCDGTDVDLSGSVDFEDLAILAEHWLEKI